MRWIDPGRRRGEVGRLEAEVMNVQPRAELVDYMGLARLSPVALQRGMVVWAALSGSVSIRRAQVWPWRPESLTANVALPARP